MVPDRAKHHICSCKKIFVLLLSEYEKHRGLGCYNGVAEEMKNDVVVYTSERDLFDTISKD